MLKNIVPPTSDPATFVSTIHYMNAQTIVVFVFIRFTILLEDQ